MPAGRPLEYSKEHLEKAERYVDDFGNYGEPRLPSIEGLAYELNVSRQTMYAWEKDYKEFSYILERLRQVQAKKLIDKGLNNAYNSTITKLMLSKHGYVEKQETDVTTNGKDLGVAISADQAEQLIRARAERSNT